MGVRLDQLLEMPELCDLKLVGGGNGTDKIVRWVHVVETPEILQYVQSGELIILTGMAVYDHLQQFIELVEGLINKNAAGLVLNVGKYISKVPEEIIRIAEDNSFAILEFPWERSIADLTRIICHEIVKHQIEDISNQELLMNIIFFNKVTYEEFMEKVSDYRYDASMSFRIAIVKMENENDEDYEKKTHVMEVFYNSVNSTASDSRHRTISYLIDKSVILLLINEKERYPNLNAFADLLRKNCKLNFPEASFDISMGNVYTEFSQIRKSYLEAEKTMKVIKAEGRKDTTMFYSETGAYKLLLDIENKGLLKEYYHDNLGKLEQYDMQNGSDFMGILYTFLQEDGNYIQTANRLFMHRNTLMYKMNKIHEILKLNLADPKVRFELYLAFMVKKIINE